MGLASTPSSCSCPAVTGRTACPVLRPCRPGNHIPALTPLQQRAAMAALHAPSTWWHRQALRRHGSQAASFQNVFSGASSSSAHLRRSHAADCPPPSELADCSRATATASTNLHSRRWGYALVPQRCHGVGPSAAADMGLSGAGPPPPAGENQSDAAETADAAAASSSAPCQLGLNASPTSNGHPLLAAAEGAAAAATAAAPQAVALAADASAVAAAEDVAADPGATNVDGLDDTRKFVLADEWGFSRVGGDLPDGTTPATFADMFPERFFTPDPLHAAAAVALPLASMAAGYAWLWYFHSICPAWQQFLAAALIGTAYTGLFKIAHECARFAFLPQSPRLQDFLGVVLMLPSLYPFTSWRLHYMHHLVHLNELWEDTFGWHPYTKLQLATEILSNQRWRVRLRRLALATPLKLLGSVGHWLKSFDGLDLKRFHPETHWAVLAGWAAPMTFVGVGVPAILAAGGVSGFISGYLLPWLVFHFWLSTLSLVQHTAPHIPWRAEGEGYDAGRSAVCGTVTLRLPRPLEVLLNDANYSLPQLLAPGLPVFRAREAYEYARERLLPYMTEATLSVKLLVNHVTKWQVYDEEKHTYEPLEDVLQSVDADIAAAMKEVEQWQAANPGGPEAAQAQAAVAGGAA